MWIEKVSNPIPGGNHHQVRIYVWTFGGVSSWDILLFKMSKFGSILNQLQDSPAKTQEHLLSLRRPCEFPAAPAGCLPKFRHTWDSLCRSVILVWGSCLEVSVQRFIPLCPCLSAQLSERGRRTPNSGNRELARRAHPSWRPAPPSHPALVTREAFRGTLATSFPCDFQRK